MLNRVQRKMVSDNSLRKRKKLKTRMDILLKARELFSNSLYRDVSLEDIANHAMLSRPTIYKYFPNGKEEIYFTLGIEAFKLAIPQIEPILDSGMNGLEQFLLLCDFTYQTVDRMPLLFEIIAKFYNHLNIKDIDWEKKHDLIASINDAAKNDMRLQLEEPHLFDFYIILQQTAFIWNEAVEIGLNDGSIRAELTSEQITHFINLTVVAQIREMHLRRRTLERISLTKDMVRNESMKMIRRFLAND